MGDYVTKKKKSNDKVDKYAEIKKEQQHIIYQNIKEIQTTRKIYINYQILMNF